MTHKTINTGQRKKKIVIWEAKEERKKVMRERKKYLRRKAGEKL